MTLRILHTADWHLGDRLGGLDRLPDQLERLGQLIAHAEAERADVLLVCGDVLEEARPHRLAPIVSEVARLLEPGLERGMQCVLLAGNHDSRHTFELLAGLQRLLGGAARRVRFVGAPELVPLATAAGTPAASLVALPYPTAASYNVDAQLPSIEEKRERLRQAIDGRIEALAAAADPELPLIAAGHFLVGGAPAVTGARELAEEEDVPVDRERLGGFAYVALGHVHEPVQVSDRIRYSGALDRIDFGEADGARQAVLIELEQDGTARQHELPLDPTPMASFEIGSLADLTEKAELLEDPARTIVKLTLRLGREDSASLWLAEARARFPRLFQPPALIQLDDPLPALVTGEIEHADLASTVRGYLDDELAGDPDRDDLLAIVEQLLAGQAEGR